MVHPTYDPYSLVNLVMQELSRKGIKSHFWGGEIGDAAKAAEDMLCALGIAPVVADNGE